MATVPEGTPGRRRRRGGRRPPGLRRGAVAAAVPAGADRRRAGVLGALRRPAGGDGRAHHDRDGLADVVLEPGAEPGAVDADRGVPRHRAGVPVGGGARRRARVAGARPARAGRRGGGDPAVERPAVHDHVEAGAGAARGLHGGREARPRDPARPLPARRAAGGGRRPGRRRQHRRRRPRDGRAPGGAPRRRQGRLHRVDGGRPQDRRGLRRAAQAGQPRARRQVGRDRARRRRPRRHHGRACGSPR